MLFVEWISVPTFDSFVYHVREIGEDGNPGMVVLQHRAGFVPIGNPNNVKCDLNIPDIEPVNPETAERTIPFMQDPKPEWRPCNSIDLAFRNQAGCPLHAYWAKSLTEVPQEGFSCGEEFKFHLGTLPATQDFMDGE